MIQPTQEQLAVLSPTERLNFRLADFVAQHCKPASVAWNSTFTSSLLWSYSNRRLNVDGLEHLRPYTRQDSLLLVSNHRTFFDFFVITAVCFWHTQLSRRILFPVRSNFFYDEPLGPLVNAIMSGMSMFPPMVRSKGKSGFNKYSVQRCIAELQLPGTLMGLHPEGTRCKEADPYRYLPAKAGVGQIALHAGKAKVIPFFITGMGNEMRHELQRNWVTPEEHPIDVVVGAPIDFSEIRDSSLSNRQQHLEASRLCMSHIERLGEYHRQRYA